MLLKFIFHIALVCFFLPATSFAQKRTPDLFLDFDTDSLKGKERIMDLQKLDSFQKYLGLTYNKNGRPARLILHEKNSKEQRVGKFINKSYGTVIGFNTLKTYGYEQVLIFGDRDYFFDSILVKKDTVIGRQICDDYLKVTACWKKSKDTIILKQYSYSYRGEKYYPKSYFIPLSKYKEYFTSWLFKSARTLQIVRAGDKYQVYFLDPEDNKLSDFDKNVFNNYCARWGHSLFWLVVAGQVFLD